MDYYSKYSKYSGFFKRFVISLNCFLSGATFMDSQSDFMKKVDGIRLAEKEAENIVKSSEQKAEKIIQDTRDSITSLKTKNNEEIVKLKNDILIQSKKAIESQVQNLIKKEQEKISKISKLCIDKKQASTLVAWFLDSV